jgi:hypothetical protein
MKGADGAGAKAAATYFMELATYAMGSGDLTEWAVVSGQTCRFCDGVRGVVETAYGAHHRIEGRTVDVNDAEVLGQDPQVGVYSVRLGYSLTESSEIDQSGALVYAFPAEEGEIIIDVQPSLRGWLLIGGDGQ